MTEQKIDSSKVTRVVSEVVGRLGKSADELIPILNSVNREIGYLPAEALEEISVQLKVPKSQLFSVATFYRMLSTKERGRHVIQFCESAPCHVAGGREVWDVLKNQIHMEANGISEDGKWSLITTSCLGICGVGPVIVIDEDIYGNVKAEQVAGILARYE